MHTVEGGVCRVALRRRLKTGQNLDFVTGFNLLDVSTQEEILRLMERPKWSFTGGRIPNQFWHMDGLEAEPFFRQKLFSRICKSLGQEYDVVRVYGT